MTTPTQNDGGPAFPHADFVQTIYDDNGRVSGSRLWEGQRGMSLRDWFAGNERIGQEERFEWKLCEDLAGPRPDATRQEDPLAWELWTATWMAKIRYIRADAMLAAREWKEGQP